MTKEKEDRKKKEKKEKKERKRREAEELEVKEKKISKKHKSQSKKSEKPEKSKKKSKKSDVEEEKPHKKSKRSDVEEEKPHKKSKESKKKHKISDESEEPPTQIVPSDVSHVPIATTNNNESDSDFESDKEDIKHLLESYSKEELVNLIYKTAEKGSRLISAVLESADRDSAKRNIFVRGLGWDTTHENLKAAFEVYGEIEECSVVMDKDTGRAKGYGFVMFKTRKGAREALRNPEKRMYNRTVSCNLAAAKPSGVGKAREPVESVKIDLTRTANQSEVALPGLDLGNGHVNVVDNGHQQQNMPMYAGQNMPFYGHSQPPGFNPMYGPLMGNQGLLMGNQMLAGLPNYRMFGSGMMNQGAMMPPNHMGMTGQYAGDGNGVGAGPGFEGDRAWYLR